MVRTPCEFGHKKCVQRDGSSEIHKHEVGGSGAHPRWRIRDPVLFPCRLGKAWLDVAMGATPEPHPPSRSQAVATLPGLLTDKKYAVDV